MPEGQLCRSNLFFQKFEPGVNRYVVLCKAVLYGCGGGGEGPYSRGGL